MKILFVDQTAQLGGAELWLKDIVLRRGGGDRVYLFQTGPLAEILSERGVDVLCYEAAESLAGLRKDSGLWIKLLSSRAVLQMVREVAKAARDIDVIYANTPKALVVSALAGVWARKPVVYHLHDILSREHFSGSNLRLLVTLSNRFVTHVVANSQSTLAAYRKAGGKQKCSISYNGFAVDDFVEAVSHREQYARAVREELQLPPAARLVAVFGRLAPWKGQHIAMSALERLPDVHLMLVGEALFGEQEYKDKLTQLASASSVAGRVHFLGFRRDVLPLMQAVDMVVHCSVAAEPFGRVIVESMLSRRPIIAANAGGAQEIVTDGVDGFLFPPGDAQALADRIEQMSRLDEGERMQLLDRAFESASRRFSLQKAVADVGNVAQDCM